MSVDTTTLSSQFTLFKRTSLLTAKPRHSIQAKQNISINLTEDQSPYKMILFTKIYHITLHAAAINFITLQQIYRHWSHWGLFSARQHTIIWLHIITCLAFHRNIQTKPTNLKLMRTVWIYLFLLSVSLKFPLLSFLEL